MVGRGPGVFDPELDTAVPPDVAAVAGPVVGQDPFDTDASLGEPGDGPVQERDAVGGVLGAGELAVGQPRVGVDGGVDVGVAAAAQCDRRLVSEVRPSLRCPPPSGIRASFLTSMWTSSPQRSVSMRRMTRPVGRSIHRKRFTP